MVDESASELHKSSEAKGDHRLIQYENVLNKLRVVRREIVLWADLLLRDQINRSEGKFFRVIRLFGLSTIIGFLDDVRYGYYIAPREKFQRILSRDSDFRLLFCIIVYSNDE